ncbi:MAG: hypothetical protein K2M47_01730 [Clostridiales bacterium]|nr:hypothetical protein [Clostridiales bacterium]
MAKSLDFGSMRRPIKACKAEYEDGVVTFEHVRDTDMSKQGVAVSAMRSETTDYVTETALRQSIIVSEILSLPIEEVLNAVAPIFMCGTAEQEQLERHLNDPTFSGIRSSMQAAIYRRYICSFCGDPHAYGKTPGELRALDVKEKAYAFLDSLTDSYDNAMFDAVSVLAKKQGSNNDSYGEYQLTYSLVMYLQDKPKEMVLPSLNGSLKKGCVAAGLMMLYVEQDADKRESIYARLQGIADFKLREGLANTVCSVYSIMPNNFKRNDFLGAAGGDNE